VTRLVALGLLVGVLLFAGSVRATPGPPQPPQPLPTTTTSSTGLVGYVARGPLAPTCHPFQPCFRPARVVLRFARDGVVKATAATRVSGSYRVALAPGVYTVSVAARAGRLKQSTVRVPTDRWHHVNFVLSTGIY
jgi:hypothetical protein